MNLKFKKIPKIKLFKDPVLGETNIESSSSETHLTNLGNRELLMFPIKTSAK